MQEKYDLVIVGGGIWGNAIAYYHSSVYPDRSILVVERQEMNNGATSRAAALLTKVRTATALIPLAQETTRIISVLEEKLEESLDVKRAGLVYAATNQANSDSLDRLRQIAGEYHEPFKDLTIFEFSRMVPWLSFNDKAKFGYFPGESYCDPYLLGSFFARAARMNGVAFRGNCRVERLLHKNNTITGILTDRGTVAADQVVVAAGVWSNTLLADLDLAMPYAPVRSQFWITEPIEDLPAQAPIVLVPEANAYMRPEGNCILFGIREPQSLAVSPDKVPYQMNEYKYSEDKGFTELAGVIHFLEPYFPNILDIGIKSYMAGFSGYSPDSMITVGTCRGIKNLFLAGGDCGAGIALAGGVGKIMNELLNAENPSIDIEAFRPDRFTGFNGFSEDWLNKCAEARSRKKGG